MCVDYKSELTYVERGLNRFGDVIISDKAFLDYVYETVKVLPIVSDPTSEDGDGDTVPDDVDIEPLVPYLMVSDCIFESDSTHISISNIIAVNNYIIKQEELNDLTKSNLIYHNMFNVRIEINCPDNGSCFENNIFFNGDKSNCSAQIWKCNTTEYYFVDKKVNTFYINNCTDRQLVYSNYRIDF